MKKIYSNKISFDKFYTKETVVKECISHIDFSQYDFVIEPSAGNGAFLKNIQHDNVVGIDIDPEHSCIKKMSWFDYNIPEKYENVLVIGNPPFGIRNELSKQFIIHASKFKNVKTIAFILPDVYNKHTLQRYVPKRFNLTKIIKMQENAFMIGEKEYNVCCSFFVFQENGIIDLRFNPTLYKKSIHWHYGSSTNYDFFVMGAAPWNIKDFPTEKNRGYFIKINKDISLDEIKNRFRRISTKGYSSVRGGAFWLTKPELVKIYDDLLKTETENFKND